MSYLSRMHLHPRRRGTTELLANPWKMHAAVMSCFPPEFTDESTNRVLWRVDRSEHSISLYTVSPDKPSFTHLQEQAGWENQPSWDTAPYDPLLNRIRTGATYRFRLTANPSKTIRTEAGERRQAGLLSAADQTKWLTERAEKNGFSVSDPESSDSPAFQITSKGLLRFNRGRRTVTLARAQYDGVLTVTDLEQLRRALVDGIGRAKGFGMGLLTLAPAG